MDASKSENSTVNQKTFQPVVQWITIDGEVLARKRFESSSPMMSWKTQVPRVFNENVGCCFKRLCIIVTNKGRVSMSRLDPPPGNTS
ncbi:hypothetical protein MTP99_017214 [Tenebrio molitor]|nr:hypothetical protein MTP99_017214 [Tenebrio molitor]